MRTNRFMNVVNLAALSLCTWLAMSPEASAQAPTPFLYNRVGTLHAGIQCVTWDDVQFETWTLTGPVALQVPFNVEVRVIGTATPGLDPNCAASGGMILVSSVLMVTDDPGTDFCLGDGGDQAGCTNCPCGNNAPIGSNGGCLNSAGSSAELISEGTDSLLAADLCFRMENGVPNSFSILVSGTAQAPSNPLHPCFTLNPGSGVQSMAFDGLRCAVGNIVRHGGRSVDANGEVGGLSAPWGFCSAGFPGNSVFAAGQTRFFQSIYRDNDQAVCMRGLNTTQGTAITFTP